MSEKQSFREISKDAESKNSDKFEEKYKEIRIDPKKIKIPVEWNLKTVGEISDKVTDGTHQTPEYVGKGIPFLSTKNLVPHTSKFDFSDYEKYITEKEHGELTKRCIPERNDLLVSKCGTIGQSQLIRNDLEFSIFVGLALIKLQNSEVNGTYLEEFINSETIRKVLQARSPGSTRNTLNIGSLKKLEIPIPPTPEQEKIASVLYNVDRAIQKTEEIIEQTKRVKKGLMQELFTKGYFDHARIVGVEKLKTGSGSINTSLDETTIGQIPGSWECKRLEEVTNDSCYGAAESAENFDPEKLRYIRITDIGETGLLKNEEKKSLSKKKAKEYLLNPGELLFARSGATVGKTFLYTEEDPEAVYGGYLIRFKPDRNIILPKFLFYYTQTKNYRKWVERVTRKGAQENINAREYSSILLPIPPIEEQKKIVDVIDNFYEKEKLENHFIENLNRFKKGLTQDLLTGRVRTKDRPIEVLPEVKAYE